MGAIIGLSILRLDDRTREILAGVSRELDRGPWELTAETHVVHVNFMADAITGREAWDLVRRALDAQGDDWSDRLHMGTRPEY